MKRIILLFVSSFCLFSIYAQVPYFSSTVGNGKIYAYTSYKWRFGANHNETYSCVQYGVTDYAAIGTDLYTMNKSAYLGLSARGGYKFSNRFGIGAQITPSFDLNDKFSHSYTTAALYMNGNISADGKLFWCSNTWWGINTGAANSLKQWTYLGYTFKTGNKQSITPMVGEIHSWKMDEDTDLSVGLYYTIGKCNIYLWSNDLFQKKPRFVTGVDFTI